MKYIRTKDRIIDLQLWNNHNVIMFNSRNCYNRKNIVHHYEFYIKNDEVYAIPKKEDGTRLDKKYNDILVEYNISKQADTIEELCDEFVIVRENGKSMTALLDLAKEYAKAGIKVYGAIWTSKGLIYVAKMNDKGELVLL